MAHKVLLQNIAFKIFDGSEQVVLISIINALILIPFILLFTVSGFLSDKYDKKNILVYGAVSSFTLSVLMVIAYFSGNFYFAMFVLVLLAVQSTIYSPAKFGIIIDIYGKKNLSTGNSHLQSLSIIAILFSIAIASYFFEDYYNVNKLGVLETKEELLLAILPLTLYILPVAFLEMLISILALRNIKTSHKNNDSFVLDKKDLMQGKLLKKNLKIISSNNVIFKAVMGLSVFWGISQAMMAVFPSYGKQYLGVNDVFVINAVIAASGIGIAIGAYLYSKVSQHYIEVGTIPLASLGMGVCIFVATIVDSAFLIGVSFLVFGIFGGMFVVPLNALIQFNAKKKELGTVIAGNNWYNSLAMFLMLCMTTTVSLFHLDPLNTIYIILLITVIGTFYTVYKLPQSFALLFLKAVFGVGYNLDVKGIKNIPSSGGALLLGNHLSWVDWAIVLMASPREVKFVMDRPIYEKWYLNWLLRMFKTIPISQTRSKDSIKKVASELDKGSLIVLFPEGSITTTGEVNDLKKGFEKILELCEKNITVIPFYIDGLWGSKFSKASKDVKSSTKVSKVTISFARRMKKHKVNSEVIKESILNLS